MMNPDPELVRPKGRVPSDYPAARPDFQFRICPATNTYFVRRKLYLAVGVTRTDFRYKYDNDLCK